MKWGWGGWLSATKAIFTSRLVFVTLPSLRWMAVSGATIGKEEEGGVERGMVVPDKGKLHFTFGVHRLTCLARRPSR